MTVTEAVTRIKRSFPVRGGLLAAALLADPCVSAAADEPVERGICKSLDLAVESIDRAPTAYRVFCRANLGECELGGAPRLNWTPVLQHVLERINNQVNAEIRFITDIENLGREEVWSYPDGGWGDCEDIALEKRRRLVESGLPRGALTLAIIHHRSRYFSHTVLLAETSLGTLVLDNLTSKVNCWNDIDFNFETRERPDSRWDRYDQREWIYGPSIPAAQTPKQSAN
ncbi:transglutaminase-like cysteine peptidase [Piscinibacter sakaiensis]|uniref:transglutaminase-like cysteine peptidase n=1 Tax=Piscinibacter sakaiensis TaxID=1547922 RepID=UPI003AAFBE34